MSPSKFLDKNISIDEDFTNMAGMIPTNFIVLNALILTMVLFVEFLDPFTKVLRLRG